MHKPKIPHQINGNTPRKCELTHSHALTGRPAVICKTHLHDGRVEESQSLLFRARASLCPILYFSQSATISTVYSPVSDPPFSLHHAPLHGRRIIGADRQHERVVVREPHREHVRRVPRVNAHRTLVGQARVAVETHAGLCARAWTGM